MNPARSGARHLLCALVAVQSSLGIAGTALAQDDPAPVRFNRQVRPLLAARCFHCHGPDSRRREAHLRLDRPDGAEGAYRTRKGKVAVQPGSLERSELWRRVTSPDPKRAMPPRDSHKERLDADELAVIRRWIEQGARYEDHWAFVAPEPPASTGAPVRWHPAGAAPRPAAHPIDRLVAQRLQAEGLRPSPRADRRTLIRRLSLDLTGLPPSRDEVRAFLADQGPAAYERLVDALLARPQYGEHMARYWLDLVRFADTNGVHHDHYREMSPYRDWVIRSFNANQGYDRFVTDQIAGDLHPRPTDDQLVASGFNRLHMIIDRGTALPEESFARNVIDRVTAFGTGFLGLTLQCAVCHDHKYDPVEQRDFYRLFAFFNNLDGEPETGGRGTMDFRRGLQPPYIELFAGDQERELALLDCRLVETDDLIETLTREERRAKDKKRGDTDKGDTDKGDTDKGGKTDGRGDTAPGTDPEPCEPGSERNPPDRPGEQLAEARKERKRLQKQRDDLLLSIPAAMVMKERRRPREAHILIRGAYDHPGEPVERGTPAFLPVLQVPEGATPSRMDLARWLVAPGHPLTARVAVNRFWQQLFGVGLVRTAEDFGTQGEWPSYPELLDYLAVTFVESGWDVKALLRRIVTSETYRQSSAATAAAFERDPDNRLLARGSRFRLDAEVIRDQILATSGLLNREMFGRSVKPPQPEGIWKAVTLPSSFPRTYQADTGDKIHRRSVYTFWKRGMPPPQMSLLNAPTRESCTARRERTNTPLQALLLWNEAEYLKAARHLAERVLGGAPATTGARLDLLFETITSRAPDRDELAALAEALGGLRAEYASRPELAARLCQGVELGRRSPVELSAWTMVASTIFNLDITKTRQ